MTAYTHETTHVGRDSTAPELIVTRTIGFWSVLLGDGSNSNQTTRFGQLDSYLGWAATYRWRPVMYIPTTTIPRASKVLAATLHQYAIGRDWRPTLVAPAGARISIYAISSIYRPLEPTLPGLTSDNWKTSNAWQEKGGRLTSGLDVEGQLADFAVPSSVATTAANDPTYPTLLANIDLRDYLQQQVSRGKPGQLLWNFNWANLDTSGFGYHCILLDRPDDVTQKGLTHSYWTLDWKYSRSFYYAQATGTRKPDRTRLLSVLSSSPAQHILQGKSVSKGSQSSTTDDKVWMTNEQGTPQIDCFLHAGAASVGAVDTSLAPSGVKLCGVHGYPYDGGASNAVATGTAALTFTSGTLIDVDFTDDTTGVTTNLATGLNWTTDHVVQKGGKDFLFIPGSGVSGTVAWDGTPSTGDVLTFEIRGDISTDTAPLSGLDEVWLVPVDYTDSARNTADDVHKRLASAARTQQVHSDSNVVLNSTVPSVGTTAPVSTVVDSGTWVHIKLPLPSGFTLPGWGTLVSDTVTPRIQHVYATVAYPITDAIYPGQVRATTTVGGATGISNPGDFGTNAKFTTGLYLPGWSAGAVKQQLAALASAFLSSASIAGSKVVGVNTALAVSHDSVVTIMAPTGESEVLTVDVATSSNITFTTVPGATLGGFTFPAGSLVFLDDSASSSTFYVFAAPTGALGQRLGLLASEEWANHS